MTTDKKKAKGKRVRRDVSPERGTVSRSTNITDKSDESIYQLKDAEKEILGSILTDPVFPVEKLANILSQLVNTGT
ncbi:1149_t:CDS:1, partial [Paraglomus brasilianum]